MTIPESRQMTTEAPKWDCECGHRQEHREFCSKCGTSRPDLRRLGEAVSVSADGPDDFWNTEFGKPTPMTDSPADPEGLRDVCEECGHPRAYHDDDACLHLEGNPLAGEGIECRCGEFVLMSDMSVSADRPAENSELRERLDEWMRLAFEEPEIGRGGHHNLYDTKDFDAAHREWEAKLAAARSRIEELFARQREENEEAYQELQLSKERLIVEYDSRLRADRLTREDAVWLLDYLNDNKYAAHHDHVSPVFAKLRRISGLGSQ